MSSRAQTIHVNLSIYRTRIGILTFFDIIVPFHPLICRRTERYVQGRNEGRNAKRGGTERNEKRENPDAGSVYIKLKFTNYESKSLLELLKILCEEKITYYSKVCAFKCRLS
jgi:hypothetical protein